MMIRNFPSAGVCAGTAAFASATCACCPFITVPITIPSPQAVVRAKTGNAIRQCMSLPAFPRHYHSTPLCPDLWNPGNQFDFDASHVIRELHAEGGTGGCVLGEVLRVNLVHAGLLLPDVGKEYGHLDDVFEGGAHLLQVLLVRFEDDPGLILDIVTLAHTCKAGTEIRVSDANATGSSYAPSGCCGCGHGRHGASGAEFRCGFEEGSAFLHVSMLARQVTCGEGKADVQSADMRMNRREFLISGPAAGAAAATDAPRKSRVGLVSSGHSKLRRPLSPEDPLDYAAVRDMVWTAIGYGKPRAGKLEAKVPAGCWVVVKPNIVFLPPQGGYRPGDITDLRVTKAVVEYVARYSRAARGTSAEGGSYRGVRDPAADTVVQQNGARVDCAGFDWGADEYPGFRGSVAGILEEFGRQFPRKKFDYIDLNYDAVRDPSGAVRRIPVPRTPRGVGG